MRIGGPAHGLDPILARGDVHSQLVHRRDPRALVEMIGEFPENRRIPTLLKGRRKLIEVDIARCGEGIDGVSPFLLSSLRTSREGYPRVVTLQERPTYLCIEDGLCTDRL